MKYCVECGTKLKEKYLEGEGMIPFCEKCEAFRFPIFNTAVSMVVMNERADKILLIQQYGKKSYILVAGYVNKGECAEEALIREVMEETGLEVVDYQFNESHFYEPSNTLMVNFGCRVKDECLDGLTKEVDKATWFSIEDAKEQVKDGSLAENFLMSYLKKREKAVKSN